jgi:hypothetical protein
MRDCSILKMPCGGLVALLGGRGIQRAPHGLLRVARILTIGAFFFYPTQVVDTHLYRGSTYLPRPLGGALKASSPIDSDCAITA